MLYPCYTAAAILNLICCLLSAILIDLLNAQLEANDELLSTRNSKDFPIEAPDIRVPYQILYT
jgi:hypothetical protein